MDQVRFNNIFATTEVDFSPIETKTLQLKVGRCNNGYFDERQQNVGILLFIYTHDNSNHDKFILVISFKFTVVKFVLY